MKDNNNVSFEDTAIAFSSRTDAELKKVYFLFNMLNRKELTKIGTYFVKTALKLKLPVQNVLKKTLYKHFCGGENLEECKTTISGLVAFGIATVLDYSAEGENSEKNYDKTVVKIMEAIEFAGNNISVPFVVIKISGLTGCAILEKLQSGETLSPEELFAFENAKNRIDKICLRAAEKDVRLLIDAEESWIQGTIDTLAYTMMSRYNKGGTIVYNTYQMYRADMEYNLKQELARAKEENFRLGVKLVRGAYIEKEKERARKMNYEDPIHKSLEETHESFNNAVLFCLENLHKISFLMGTHNETSNYYLLSLMKKMNLPKNHPEIYFSQLLGMSDNISYNLAKAGYNVAKYVPFGPVGTVIPYLLRRAEENKAVMGETSREFEYVEKEMKRRGL